MRRTLGAVGVVTAVAAWELSARAGWVNAALLTPPSVFIPAWRDMVASGEIAPHVGWTVLRISVGMVIGSLAGVLLGITCYLVRPLRHATAPVVEIVRAVPPLALLPAFLLLFGIGFRFPVAIVVYVTWVPVFLNTLDGLDNVPQSIREAAWEYTSMPYVVWRVSIPTAAPQILIGLRLAMGAAFLSIVAAEMMGSTVGLGYYILDASATFRIPQMYAAIATLGGIAFLANALVVGLAHLVWPHIAEG